MMLYINGTNKPKTIISGQSESAKIAVEFTVHCPDLESEEGHLIDIILLIDYHY